MNSVLTNLRIKYGNRCHYCGRNCRKRRHHPHQGTKEHIVPKFFGGANRASNYTFVCSECNNFRGTKLFFCQCDLCGPLIQEAISNQEIIDRVFFGLAAFNRIRVFKTQRESKPWVVRQGYSSSAFTTHAEAINYAFNTKVKESNGV